VEPTIYLLTEEPVAALAAEELGRCLTAMTGEQWTTEKRPEHVPTQPGLWLGLVEDFGWTSPPGLDPRWDDEVRIETDASGGVLAGPNPRSLLFAVYRYLTELGCRWVRPGARGERLPRLEGPLPPVSVHETPSYRHRGVCIEGAVSFEHVRDMVDWLPKLGLNAYFIQFREAYTFFERWYRHESNPTLEPADFSLEHARELTRRVRAEVKSRGLLLHMVGHGWTCEPFGIPGTGWTPYEDPLPPEVEIHLAEVKGKRELWGGMALNTNLCYGNPDTRAILTDAVVEYVRGNPDVDILHVWLADGSNNQCECPLCRDHRPADLYVRMLNELDGKLTREGLDVRLVFLAYVDLLWPPEHERLANPDRFILMFAPITRSYSTSFTAADKWKGDLPPYVRNALQFPREPALNLAFLDAWREGFRGDSFDFDYHLMWDHYKDPGQYGTARVLHEDLCGLLDVGLNGLVSCQVQRVFFPTALPMAVLGRTLWDRDASFDAIAADYFSAAFGEDGHRVRRCLETLSRLFNAPVLRGEGDDEARQAALRDWRTIEPLADRLEALANAHRDAPDAAVRYSWELLAHHAELTRLLARALVARHGDDPETAREAACAVVEWAWRHDEPLQDAFEAYEFLQVILPILGLSRQEIEARAAEKRRA